MNVMLHRLRSSAVSLLPDPMRGALRQAREEHHARMKKLEQISWMLQEFSPPQPARWVRTVARIWLLPRRRVLFYPKHPTRGGIYFKACVRLGYATTDRPTMPYDIAIHYYGGTYGDGSRLADLSPGVPVLNRDSLDISKQYVQKIFERIFGYELAVDPTTYHGAVVEKSDVNATHDGRLLQGPIPAAAVRPGFVYQKLVDTSDGEGHILDMRVPLMCGTIPLVYKKWRPIHDRFGRDVPRAEICEVSDMLSADEQARLTEMARAMAVDLGEMDVLRDNTDGRIYVVDVNNTPDGPPQSLTPEDKVRAVSRMSSAFAEVVHNACARRRTPHA